MPKESWFLNRRIKPRNQCMYESRAIIDANLKLAHSLALDSTILGRMCGPWIAELLYGIIQLDHWAVIGAYVQAELAYEALRLDTQN